MVPLPHKDTCCDDAIWIRRNFIALDKYFFIPSTIVYCLARYLIHKFNVRSLQKRLESDKYQLNSMFRASSTRNRYFMIRKLRCIVTGNDQVKMF
jgi:hypothetical protein